MPVQPSTPFDMGELDALATHVPRFTGTVI
jgi:hypothetical protein